ncbi:autophagy-related protein 9-like [Ziziphus jujuba]|uniref:Autophagy-related protein 9-like n=1 Tax=Ziziphus jujuba TaxID=326968 RepID=A0ABM3ZT06_ZIZJJ|nr:autophagy-related protein 9-like [Ziziphus jujuba]
MGIPCVQFFKNKENLRLFFFYTPGAGSTVKSGSKGKHHHLILTKTLEWTLNWCILQSMFDRSSRVILHLGMLNFLMEPTVMP